MDILPLVFSVRCPTAMSPSQSDILSLLCRLRTLGHGRDITGGLPGVACTSSWGLHAEAQTLTPPPLSPLVETLELRHPPMGSLVMFIRTTGSAQLSEDDVSRNYLFT